MKENEPKNQIHIFIGAEALNLPNELKQKYSEQISTVLASHESTMLQFSAVDIKKIMDKANVIIAVDEMTNTVCGFIQMFPWTDKNDSIDAIELRSWISTKPDVGISIAKAALSLCANKYGNVPVYGVAAAGNFHAQEKLLSLGGREVAMPESMGFILKSENKVTPVRVFLLKGGEKYEN